MRTHVEIERKYEAESDIGVPALDTIPGVAATTGPRQETLEATYYDTPDHRLVRAGMTLRRREGGEDAGWHLKVPSTDDERTEIRLPPNGELDQLADLTLGYTRGAPLHPVATITTDRTHWDLLGRKGKLLAEVSDDRVTSGAKQWREIEVELGEGDPELLDSAEQALRQAGFHRSKAPSKLSRVLGTKPETAPEPSRKATAGETVLAYVRTQVDRIKHYDLLVRQDADDAVHQMRVAVRRLRSALRTYKRLVDSGDVASELRWLGQRLSTARDLEVQYARHRRTVGQLPAEAVPGPVQARLTRHFAPEEEKARQVVLRTLRGRRYLRLLDQLDKLVEHPRLGKKAGRPARKELPKHLNRAYRRTAQRVDAGEVHPARKAGKRLRYALEAAVPVLGKRADKARKRVKAFTKAGGDHQDSVVALPTLRELGTQAHLSGENAFTFGVLYGTERANAAHLEPRAKETWRRVKWG